MASRNYNLKLNSVDDSKSLSVCKIFMIKQQQREGRKKTVRSSHGWYGEIFNGK